MVEEFGRLTAIDGAVLLSRELALVAFGVILPVGQPVTVEESATAHDGRSIVVDFGSRGTRHRAAATYAAEHPGSVVFVASEDGQVSCMLCETSGAPVRLWHLAAQTARGATSQRPVDCARCLGWRIKADAPGDHVRTPARLHTFEHITGWRRDEVVGVAHFSRIDLDSHSITGGTFLQFRIQTQL